MILFPFLYLFIDVISVTQVGRCPLCNPLIKEREECLFDAMIFFSGYTVNYGAKSRSCVRLVFELQYSAGRCRTKNLIFLTCMNRSSQFCRVYPVQVNLVIKKHCIAEKKRKWNPLTDALLSSLKPVFWCDEPLDKTASMP